MKTQNMSSRNTDSPLPIISGFLNTVKVLYFLPILLMVQIGSSAYSQQQFEKIITLQDDPDVTCIITLPGTDGFVMVADDGAGNHQIIRTDDAFTNDDWTISTDFFAETPDKKNKRLAYNEDEDVLIFVGQRASNDFPAYMILDASDGSLVEYNQIEDVPGVIRSVITTEAMGFFYSGYVEIDSEVNGLVGRIDPVTPGNNWHKIVDAESLDDFQWLEYFDIAVEEGTDDLLVAGHMLPSNQPPGNDWFGIQIDRFDASNGTLINNSIKFGGNDDGNFPGHLISLGNMAYMLNSTIDYNGGIYGEFLTMFYYGGSSQWAEWVAGIDAFNETSEIIEIVYHRNGFIGVLFSATEEEDIVYCLSGIDMNGDELWTRTYQCNELTDVISLEDGRFVITGRVEDENMVLIADHDGHTGCESTEEVIILAAHETTLKDEPDEDEETPFTPFEESNSTKSTSMADGTCCWIPYEEFDSRYIWHCDEAHLEDLNYDPTYDYQWYEADGETPLTGETDYFLDVTRPGEGPYTSERKVTIIDGDGCKGEDWARFTIIVSNGDTYSAGGIVEDQYCSISNPQYAPPLTLTNGHGYGIGPIGLYRATTSGGSTILTEDLNHANWNTSTTTGEHSVYQHITDPATSCDVVREYRLEVMGSCSCSQSAIDVGYFYPTGTGFKHYAITNIPQQLILDRYKITVYQDNGISADERYLVIDHHGLPWLSEYWLKGFGSPASDYILKIEAWYKNGGSDVCYYNMDSIASVDVQARKKGPGSSDQQEDVVLSEESSTISVTPNPSGGLFIFSGLRNAGLMRITDIQGRIIKEVEVVATEQTIDLSPFKPGVYLVTIIKEDTSSETVQIMKL